MTSPDLLFTRPGGSATSVKPIAHVTSWDGVYSTAAMRGENTPYIGRPGGRGNALDYDVYTFPVPLMLLGGTQAAFQDGYRALQALTESSLGTITCSRVVASSGGDLTQTCTAQARIGEVGMVNGLLNGRLTLEVTNLDGVWYGPSTVLSGISSTFLNYTTLGTAANRSLSLSLPGAGSLVNATYGLSLAVDAACTLDVLNQTSTIPFSQVHPSGDPQNGMFFLGAGLNRMKWLGSGTASITYYPAYQ